MANPNINFYHLTFLPLDKALPKLLEKVVLSDMRAIIVTNSEAQTDELNTKLWTYTTKFFLPHGTKKDGHTERQPIYLTHNNDENPNKSEVLVLLGNNQPENLQDYNKILYMFDGNSNGDLELARNNWKKFKDMGFTANYFKQDKKGAWEKK